MNGSNTNKSSKTNWAKMDKMIDSEIDTSDIPPLSDSFFASATLRAPRTVAVTLHLDPDVLAWYQAHGEEFEKYVNVALLIYLEAHKAYSL